MEIRIVDNELQFLEDYAVRVTLPILDVIEVEPEEFEDVDWVRSDVDLYWDLLEEREEWE